MKSEDTENSPKRELRRRPETWLAGSAIALTMGLVLAGTASRTGGGVLVVASWAIFVFGLHRYGRSGQG